MEPSTEIDQQRFGSSHGHARDHEQGSERSAVFQGDQGAVGHA